MGRREGRGLEQIERCKIFCRNTEKEITAEQLPSAWDALHAFA